MRLREDCEQYSCLFELRDARRNGEYAGTEDDFEISEKAFYREQQIVHCALEYPHALATTGVTPHHFDVKWLRFAWLAIDRARELIKPGESIQKADFVSFLLELNQTAFKDNRADTFYRTIMIEAEATKPYVLRVLVPEILSRHNVRLWGGRFDQFCRMVDTGTDQIALAQSFRITATGVVGEPEPGRVGISMTELAKEYDPNDKDTKVIVKLGIEQFDALLGGGHGRGELMVVGGGTSSGKCLAKYTKVLRFDGRAVDVQDVVVGDLLMGPDGLARVVLSTNTGQAQMYEVRREGGSPFRCNVDHILTLASERRADVLPRLFDLPLKEWLLWPHARKAMSRLVRSLPASGGGPNRMYELSAFTVDPTERIEDYFGFTLDGDGRFLLGDFTVTHNSYLCQRLMRRQAQLKQRCLYISVEDSEDLMRARFFADYEPSIQPTDVRDKSVDPPALASAKAKIEAECGDNIIFLDAKKWTVSQVCQAMRRHRYLFDIDLVIVDYLQAIQPDEESNNKNTDTALIVSTLKKCASEIGVALVLFSQLTRDGYRNGAEPGLVDCKYSGDIENETEFMVLMWKDDSDVLHMKIAKNKWKKSTTKRYIVHTHPTTGVIELPFEDDFEQPPEQAPRKKFGSGRGGGRSNGNGGGG